MRGLPRDSIGKAVLGAGSKGKIKLAALGEWWLLCVRFCRAPTTQTQRAAVGLRWLACTDGWLSRTAGVAALFADKAEGGADRARESEVLAALSGRALSERKLGLARRLLAGRARACEALGELSTEAECWGALARPPLDDAPGADMLEALPALARAVVELQRRSEAEAVARGGGAFVHAHARAHCFGVSPAQPPCNICHD